MKKNLLAVLILFCICHAHGQNTTCVEIDFENIPGGPYVEGAVINTQYLANFGIEFTLEDGTSPRLAQTGFPTTAFGSVWGSDEPAPGEDIGNFFLTDDGLLSGLNMIPVIVNFTDPVDSFSTCVLDIDFEEFFVIDAFDENGAILLSDTIRDGDPNTGDGLATCWGFNFDGCEGSVYAVRFEGFRFTSGAFGLGMDNFSFCFSGTDIVNNIAVETEDLTCDETTGTINVINFSDDDYLYSIDGVNFQESPNFENLPLGVYTVFVRDPFGCETELENILIEDYVPLLVDDVAAFATTCGDDNGTISVLVTPSTDVRYSLDGVNFQTSNFFGNLASGTYPVYIIDDVNCLYIEEAIVAPSSAPMLDVVTTFTDDCNDGSGEIIATGSGGSGELTYTLDGQINSTTGVFDSLLAGEYTILITDELGCMTTSVVTVTAGPTSVGDIINSVEIDVEDLTCDVSTGAINIINSGSDNYNYSLDGIIYQDSPVFDNLPLGDYTVYVQDIEGCEVEFTAVAINEYVPLVIEDVSALDTSCGEANGSIDIVATTTAGVQYSLDGLNYQAESFFDNLPAGEYEIYILDEDDCPYDDDAIVGPSSPPAFDVITSFADYCNDGNGQILVNGSGGTGELTYFLNGATSSANGVFDMLNPGEYTLELIDEAGCVVNAETIVESGPLLLIDDLVIEDLTCENTGGIIQLSASGGNGQLIYRLDGLIPRIIGTYPNLTAGTYELSVTDDKGCMTTAIASLENPICPVFVPNAFSPNDDGLNDEFVLYTNPNYDVTVLKCDIFDRWGELVWRSENFTLNTNRSWWDGNFRSQPATQGVYVYVAEVLYSNGLVEILAGDVALVR